MEPKSVFIADNQDLTREGIINIVNRVFENQVTIEIIHYKDELFLKLGKKTPDILIINYALFDFDSVCDFREVKKISPSTTSLIVSECQSYDQIKQILKMGISHYVLKTCPEEDLINALKAIMNKRKFIGSEIYDIFIQREKRNMNTPEIIKLSIGETEIVKLIAQGHTTKKIADLKNLSFHTINTHRKNIFRKLNIKSVSELVRYAMNAGLMDEIEYYI